MFMTDTEKARVSKALDIADIKKRTAAYAGAAQAIVARVYGQSPSPMNSDTLVQKRDELSDIVFDINEVSIIDRAAFNDMVKRFIDIRKLTGQNDTVNLAEDFIDALGIKRVFSDDLIATINDNMDVYRIANKAITQFCTQVYDERSRAIETY